MALVGSILILMIMPFYGNMKFKSRRFLPLSKARFWFLIVIVILLTWIGARPVEEPYILTGQSLTVLYFSYFLLLPVLNKR